MRKLRKKNIAFLVAAVLLLTGVLAGCGSDDAETASADIENTENTEAVEADSGEVETIIVGTGTAFKPYCYLDDDGNLAGYEYEVLTAIDELLPQYEFEFQTYDFKNILLSLDSGKIDLGAHQYELNEERIEKYAFTEESYTFFILYITVLNENEDINSIEDLAGKTVKASPGDNGAYVLEQFNEENPDNQINLVYVENATNEETVAGMQNGTWDAFTSIKRVVSDLNENFGDPFKTVGEPIATSFTHFAFAKDNEELRDAVDGALKELKDSGKLAEISIDVLGADYTENE